MRKGLPVVFEGRRITLRVYRRYLYPVRHVVDGKELIVYSDTGREKEINYDRAEDYGLDDPWKRMALIRLARAMKCLDCEPAGDGTDICRVTICPDRELYGSLGCKVSWVPFDPEKFKSLSERLKEIQMKTEWEDRIKRGS
jgi:hypothetical protein